MRHRLPAFVVALVALPTVAGCGSSPVTVSQGAPDDYPVLLEQGLAAGMSAEQESTLRLAIAEGRRVTFDEYAGAKQAEMDCIASLGVTIANVRRVEHQGWTEIAYGFTVQPADDTDDLHAAADECRVKHGQWVDLAYQYSPTQEEKDALFSEFRDAMVACLEGRGIQVPADASRDDIVQLDGEQSLAPGELMCNEDTGYASAQ